MIIQPNTASEAYSNTSGKRVKEGVDSALHRDAARAVVSLRRGGDVHGAVHVPAALCLGLLRQAAEIHRAGLKSYGLLVAEPGAAGYPFTATGVVFFDPR